jgi:hypothetical protein
VRRAAAKRLTDKLQKHWLQEKSSIRLFPNLGANREESRLDIMVEDPGEHVCVPLDRRGAGLGWFLALLAQLDETPRRENTLCKLFLIDEPGVFLHPSGQQDVYSVLTALSDDPGNQIIYTTHSPFMLDWSRPHEIRIVEREEAPIPVSTIVDKAYHDSKVIRTRKHFSSGSRLGGALVYSSASLDCWGTRTF